MSYELKSKKQKTNKPQKTLIVIIAFVLFVGSCGFVFQVFYPYKYSDYIAEYSKKFGIRPELVFAIINTESRFRPDALSPKGARGLMQLSEITANWGAEELGFENYTFDDVYEPELNIYLGCWYISKLRTQFDTLDNLLAAYNAGSGNVQQWLNDPNYSRDGKKLDVIPFTETENYITKVRKNLNVYDVLWDILGG